MNNQQQAFAQRLGLAGLIPFLLPALAALLGLYSAAATLVFAHYSAIILSFLGGVHWGIAMSTSASSKRQLGWSMLPSVLAISALLLSWFIDITAILALLALGHLFWLNYERRQFEQQASADWYVELRRQLTFTVVALHVILIIISWS
jgi:steroid 5-alpha reductase family enzyme